jgi:Ion channel
MQKTGEQFHRLQERLKDPLLTALTIMMAVLMFVVAPMQAIGVLAAHHFGIAFALLLVAAVFMVSGSAMAVGAILLAITLVVIATTQRVREPSIIDIYLDASAWLIAGVTLGVVVFRAVFAPGRVTVHRIVGAVQLYFDIALIFVALFCFVALTVPDAFAGLQVRNNLALVDKLIYFSFMTLTSVGYGDITPLHPFARSLADIEAVIGQLYPATLLARLVTLELEHRRAS